MGVMVLYGVGRDCNEPCSAENFSVLYIPVTETHLHGGFEPLSRQLCPTFTDGGPFNISNPL